ncbi:MAG: ATP-binding cassette domain-containing protein [Rhodospirillaceae bacterium]|nr:ATP-binding cassette domain-containing protein [Rhodospirillaceae bacterium]MCY4240042.1 ATP-binding cassette domain-containing protein [Rhodospirillaceae bacterium]
MARDGVVEARGVGVRFGGVSALESVDFTLADNELRCLIGPNGAGKSTFFKCLTGMLRPTEGDIRIRGIDCVGAHPHQIAGLGVGIKTQVPSVMNGLSVRENIWIAARRLNTTRSANRIVSETLERIGIADSAGDLVGNLAHGRRQLVEFGTVLAGNPWLILLDEPAAGLTADEAERAVAVIREMNERAAIIVVEHDMHFIRQLANTVTVLHRGRILTEGYVDTVLRDPVVRDVYLGKSQ